VGVEATSVHNVQAKVRIARYPRCGKTGESWLATRVLARALRRTPTGLGVCQAKRKRCQVSPDKQGNIALFKLESGTYEELRDALRTQGIW